MVIPRFVRSALQNKPLQIFGDGYQSRVFCHVKDTTRAIIELTKTDTSIGEVFNIGAGGRITINEIFYKICRIMGKNITPNYQPNRKGDIPHSNASIKKAQSMLGYMPEVEFEEGLRETIAWFSA
jgi:nucleoside-diphosphate-sugar epimerase